MTKICRFLTLCTLILCSHALAENSMPPNLATKIQAIDKLFSNTTSSRYRIEITAPSRDTPFDPPPNEASFPTIASLALSINSQACYPEIRAVIAEFLSSGFELVSNPGYPHWLWRVNERDGVKVLSVLIDDENNVICFDQRWYKVSPTLIEKMIDSFVMVSERVGKGSRYQYRGAFNESRRTSSDVSPTEKESSQDAQKK